jgi:hypothetical protein
VVIRPSKKVLDEVKLVEVNGSFGKIARCRVEPTRLTGQIQMTEIMSRKQWSEQSSPEMSRGGQ